MTKPEFKTMRPEAVTFQSNGVECIAFVMFNRCGLNLNTCMVDFDQAPKVEIKPPSVSEDPARVTVSDKAFVWFDTDLESARAIQALFQGAQPSEGEGL